jgi:hypothetical protein
MGTKANGKNAYEGGTTLRHESLPVSRRVKPPSPSPSIHSASNPGCPAVGVHSFEGGPDVHLGAITACLTRIKYVDLQKCYPVKLGEALSWCCVPLLRRIAVRAGCLEELRSSDRIAWNVGQARREARSRRACTLRMWQPLICGVPMKPGNRPPKIKRRQLIPASKRVILPARCAQVT